MEIEVTQPYTSTLGAYRKYYDAGANVVGKYIRWRKRHRIDSTLERKFGPLDTMARRPGGKRKRSVSGRAGHSKRRAMYTLPYTGIRPVPRMRPVKRHGQFAKYGFRHEREVWGRNVMNHCNYTGFMSCLPKVIGYDVGVAFIRWFMLNHYKISYSSVHDNITNNFGVSDTAPNWAPRSIRFYLTTPNVNSVTAPTTAPLAEFEFFNVNGAGPDTSKTVFQFGEWFRDTICFAVPDGSYLSHYQVSNHNANLSNTTQQITYSQCYDISGLRLKVYSKINYYIQNQTASDNNTLETDRVDVNPIHGRMYLFRGLMPVLRDSSRVQGQTADIDRYDALMRGDNSMTDGNGANDGVIIPSVNPTGVWRAPPNPDQFRNCYKSISIRLEPGQVRRGTLSYNFEGTMSYLLIQLLRATTGAATPIQQRMMNTKPLGSSVMFSLEKVLRTGSSKDVSVVWHIDRYTGARITRNPVSTMMKFYTQEPGGTDWVNDPA